ncbi:hypothetical protein L1049_010885 [Liquidambar formosana]|uniref:Annexin n=1 Tax=Liquidambar formosana TaxID=63359 RepID=A0AAP0RW77_LIQFO
MAMIPLLAFAFFRHRMALPHECEALTKAFSENHNKFNKSSIFVLGFGVDEKSLVSILGKWHPEQRKSFRKGTPQFFVEDDRLFESPKAQCLGFKIDPPKLTWLLVALVSSYRYEGPRVNEEIAKSEAKTVSTAIKTADKKKPIEDEEVIRILSTRSKPHLKAIFKHYKEICGNNIDEDIEAGLSLKETLQCLCTPQTYFSKVLDAVLKNGVDDDMKEALTRVIVTRADVDMKEIREDYHKQYGVSLSKKVEDITNGNYKDFLLTLVARGD